MQWSLFEVSPTVYEALIASLPAIVLVIAALFAIVAVRFLMHLIAATLKLAILGCLLFSLVQFIEPEKGTVAGSEFVEYLQETGQSLGQATQSAKTEISKLAILAYANGKQTPSE